MLNQRSIAYALLLVAAVQTRATADDPFQRQVMPLLKSYCAECHNSQTKEGELDLTRYTSAAALGESFRQWEHVVTFVKKKEMPPEKARQPSDAERAEILATIERLMAAEAKK